jgi:hypothetical protein
MPLRLRFEEERRIEPALGHDADTPWLDVDLTETERAQLVGILQTFDPEVDTERLHLDAGAVIFKGLLEAFEDNPVEWWSVCDEDGYVVYTLWLYFSDSGVLFDGETTKVLARIERLSFHADDDELDAADERELAAALHDAQKLVKRERSDSELATVTFARRYRY